MIEHYLTERANENQFFDELAAPDGTVYPHWQNLKIFADSNGFECTPANQTPMHHHSLSSQNV